MKDYPYGIYELSIGIGHGNKRMFAYDVTMDFHHKTWEYMSDTWKKSILKAKANEMASSCLVVAFKPLVPWEDDNYHDEYM